MIDPPLVMSLMPLPVPIVSSAGELLVRATPGNQEGHTLNAIKRLTVALVNLDREYPFVVVPRYRKASGQLMALSIAIPLVELGAGEFLESRREWRVAVEPYFRLIE